MTNPLQDMSEASAVADASGTAASTRELDVDKPYLWRVFQRDGGTPGCWYEIGAIPSEYSYVPYVTPQEVGDLGGAGDYMLIHGDRVHTVRIAQTEPRFEEVEEGE